jgi:hypothetical protein
MTSALSLIIGLVLKFGSDLTAAEHERSLFSTAALRYLFTAVGFQASLFLLSWGACSGVC